MEPYLHDGDHVLTFNWIVPKVGDVVVFALPSRHPEFDSGSKKGFFAKFTLSENEYAQNDRGVCWIKRVKAISKNKIEVEGDNKKMSSKVGPITRREIIGRVILKY